MHGGRRVAERHGRNCGLSAAFDQDLPRQDRRKRMNEQETYDPHKTDTEIRQGNKRMTNLRVLLFSGILIVVAFAVIYFVGYAAEN